MTYELAELGADVVVTARTAVARADIAGTIHETAQGVRDRGRRALEVRADLLVPDDVVSLVERTQAAFGQLDILVNNAAYIGEAVFHSFWDMTPEDWRNMMDLNVTAYWTLMKAFVPAMRTRGRGLIVNISSSDGLQPKEPVATPGHGGLGAGYPTTKAAVNQMTIHVGSELLLDGITVVALDPGYARSESAEILSSLMDLDVALAQPVEVAAKALGFISTSSDRTAYAARFVVARELVDAHSLLEGLPPPLARS